MCTDVFITTPYFEKKNASLQLWQCYKWCSIMTALCMKFKELNAHPQRITVDRKTESLYLHNWLCLHYLTSKKRKLFWDPLRIWVRPWNLHQRSELKTKPSLAHLICSVLREYYPENSHVDTGKSRFHNSATISCPLSVQGHMGETNQSVNAWEKSDPISANHLSISAVHM